MEYYQLELHFDDETHRLSQIDGLSIDKVAELMQYLSKALNLGNSSDVVLSDVKSGSYALQLTTKSVSTYTHLEVLHSSISRNEFGGLTRAEREYAEKLDTIKGRGGTLKVVAPDRDFRVTINNIEAPRRAEYFYEIGSVQGIMVAIGGSTMEGKINIRIAGEQYNIEINQEQEEALHPHYKKEHVYLTVRKKISMETEKVISATLIDYELLPSSTFRERLEEFWKNHPEGLPENEEGWEEDDDDFVFGAQNGDH